MLKLNRIYCINDSFKEATKNESKYHGSGYADGLRRDLSNKGTVVINKQKAQIVGNVCMDSCMVDEQILIPRVYN